MFLLGIFRDFLFVVIETVKVSQNNENASFHTYEDKKYS